MSDADRALELLRRMVTTDRYGVTTQATISTDLYGDIPILETRTRITLEDVAFIVALMGAPVSIAPTVSSAEVILQDRVARLERGLRQVDGELARSGDAPDDPIRLTISTALKRKD